MSMPGFRKQRHGERFVTNEMRQRADHASKQETNYMGVEIPKKTVIKLHESFASRAFPPAEYIKADVLAFHAEHGRVPTEIQVHFSTSTTKICISVPELGLPWPIITLAVKPGEFLRVQ
jgi:hypothetical protein